MSHKVSGSCVFCLSNACFMFQIVFSVTAYIFSLFLRIVFKKRLMLVVDFNRPSAWISHSSFIHLLFVAKHASEMTSICTVFVLCFRTYDNIFFGNGNSGVFRLFVVFWPGSRVTAPSINYQTTQIPIDPIKHFVKKLGLGETLNAVHLSVSLWLLYSDLCFRPAVFFLTDFLCLISFSDGKFPSTSVNCCSYSAFISLEILTFSRQAVGKEQRSPNKEVSKSGA